jgi:hypothetical protein
MRAAVKGYSRLPLSVDGDVEETASPLILFDMEENIIVVVGGDDEFPAVVLVIILGRDDCSNSRQCADGIIGVTTTTAAMAAPTPLTVNDENSLFISPVQISVLYSGGCMYAGADSIAVACISWVLFYATAVLYPPTTLFLLILMIRGSINMVNILIFTCRDGVV